MPSIDQLLLENEELRRQLKEAEEALRALGAGEVDAVLVESDREQVFTLQPADTPYRLLVEQMQQGAATLTVDGTILYCNHRFADSLRQPIQALLGKLIFDFVATNGESSIQEMLRNGQRGEVQGRVALRQPDGVLVPAYLAVCPVQEGALGTCLLVTDLTEQRRYEELDRAQNALRAVTERLELAQQAGRIGIFEWNIRTGATIWSDIQEEICGLPAGGFGGRYEDWIQTVHPSDRDRLQADVLHAVTTRSELSAEYRIVRSSGEICWIAAKGRVYCDDDGKPLSMVGVNLDISERKQAEEARRADDRRKDEFLATLAHELRNPLAPIRNAVEIIKRADHDRDLNRQTIDTLERQVAQLVRLVDDLLDVSRITRDQLELRRTRFDLSSVIHQAVETARPLAEANEHAVEVVLPEQPVFLDADAVRLTQIFSNLIHNSCKFTQPGGRIRVIAERQASDVVVSVSDNGIGISPEQLENVFEMFAQVDRTLERSRGGLGIGLTLARRLVKMHGGSIVARSEGRGCGSEFIVRLPIVADSQHQFAVPGVSAPVRIASRRILVVDDNRDSVLTLVKLLNLDGNQAQGAHDGVEALEVASKFRPGIILLDIGLPDMNGFEVCRQIRKQHWGGETVLVALTGWGQEEDRRKASDAGFDGHMVKPVEFNALSKLLDDLSAKREGPTSIQSQNRA